MQLNDGWILGLAQDLQHVVISKEVKPRELVSFFLEEVVKCLLASFKLGHDGVKRVDEACDIGQLDHMVVDADIVHDVSVILIEAFPPTLLFWQCAPHEDGL